MVEELADTLEQRRMEELFQELKKRIEESETLQQFKDQLLIDITDEGLRIQIVDRTGRRCSTVAGRSLNTTPRKFCSSWPRPWVRSITN